MVVPLGEMANRYLCAYYTTKETVTAADLRSYGQRHLPNYMLPSQFVQLEKMPLTDNGKVDKKALPIPSITKTSVYTAPKNNTEAKLVEIWAAVLELPKEAISSNDNFFELGGHSLKANAVIAKIHKEMENGFFFK